MWRAEAWCGVACFWRLPAGASVRSVEVWRGVALCAAALSEGDVEASAAVMYEANQFCVLSHSKRQVFQFSVCILS